MYLDAKIIASGSIAEVHMSENNYGALIMKSTAPANSDINLILTPGVYPISPGNSSSPDLSGGILIVHAGQPIQRMFISSSTIIMVSTYNSTTSTWSSWRTPLSRNDVGTGANQIPDMSSFFTGTVNAFRVPTGHIVQFETGITNSGGFIKSFPTPFPSACLVLIGVVLNATGARAFITANITDRTLANLTFVDQNGNGISNIFVGYIAIGR